MHGAVAEMPAYASLASSFLYKLNRLVWSRHTLPGANKVPGISDS